MKFLKVFRFAFFILTGCDYCKSFPVIYQCSLSVGCSEANQGIANRLDAVEEKVDGCGKTLAELTQLIEKHLSKAGPIMKF